MRLVVAVILMLLGGGYLGWQYLGTNVVASHSQDAARHVIVENFKARDIAKSQPIVNIRIKVGRNSVAGVGLLSIPIIGLKDAPIVDSFTQATIDEGLVGSMGVKPGASANTILLAHIVSHGEPFKNLADLRAGGIVKIKTRDGTFTYQIRSAPVTVKDTDTWPMLPVPDPQAKGGEKVKPVATLITCASRFTRTDNRLVVIADLISSKERP